MRKGADGLADVVRHELALDPQSQGIFIFSNRARNKLKILFWECNGFWVCYKRLSKQRFHWPNWFHSNELVLNRAQCDLLLDGYNLNAMRPHDAVVLEHLY